MTALRTPQRAARWVPRRAAPPSGWAVLSPCTQAWRARDSSPVPAPHRLIRDLAPDGAVVVAQAHAVLHGAGGLEGVGADHMLLARVLCHQLQPASSAAAGTGCATWQRVVHRLAGTPARPRLAAAAPPPCPPLCARHTTGQAAAPAAAAAWLAPAAARRVPEGINVLLSLKQRFELVEGGIVGLRAGGSGRAGGAAVVPAAGSSPPVTPQARGHTNHHHRSTERHGQTMGPTLPVLPTAALMFGCTDRVVRQVSGLVCWGRRAAAAGGPEAQAPGSWGQAAAAHLASSSLVLLRLPEVHVGLPNRGHLLAEHPKLGGHAGSERVSIRCRFGGAACAARVALHPLPLGACALAATTTRPAKRCCACLHGCSTLVAGSTTREHSRLLAAPGAEGVTDVMPGAASAMHGALASRPRTWAGRTLPRSHTPLWVLHPLQRRSWERAVVCCQLHVLSGSVPVLQG